MSTYYCYLLTCFPNNKIRTYIGITNNLEKRIMCHNGILKGGAKSTKMYSNWNYCLIMGDFKTKGDAQSFEALWKNMNKKKSGIKYKLFNLFDLLRHTKWSNIKIKC